MDDERLMEDFYGGDDAPLGELYNRYLARLVRFFRNGGLSEADAEDQANTVFLRVMETRTPPPGRNPQRFDARQGAFRAWLFTIAARMRADAQRGRATVSLDAPAPAAAEEPSGALSATVPDNRPGPELVALARERRQVVRECLEELSEESRQVLALWLESDGELTYQALGEALGVALSTAYNRFQRALQPLAACLQRRGIG